MHFEEDYIYHIYNRSNETVFYNNDNYLYFIGKIRKLIFPVSEILAWCLMPNHFHFLISANAKSVEYVKERHRPETQILAKNIGTLLSSYTRAINKANGRRGKLFAHNTEAKQITHKGYEYIENCFFYIHQNPLKAKLVNKLEDWKYSSFSDYAGLRNGTLINRELAYEIINIDKDNFYQQSYAVIEEDYIKGFYD